MRFAGSNRERTGSPIDIGQANIRDFARAEAQHREAERHCIVTTTANRLTIKRVEKALHLRRLQVHGDVGETPACHGRNDCTDIVGASPCNYK